MNLIMRFGVLLAVAVAPALPAGAAYGEPAAAPAYAPTAAAKTPSTLAINLAGLCDWNTELPLVDLMKTSRPWIIRQKGGASGSGPQVAVDARGWVTHLDPGCSVEVPLLTDYAGHVPPGEFVVLYDGNGSVDITDSKIDSKTPGRIVFTPKGMFWLRLSSIDPANYPKNIRVLLPGSERTYRTNPFNTTFLRRWRGVSCLRFMGWMDINETTVSRWTDRTRPDDFSYASRKGAPVELMVDLANRLGADPWFCMPHQADDDYVRAFAALVKQRLAPKRKVYIEYSNEVWNNMFPQSRYAITKGQELHFGAKERPWEGGGAYYAHRSVEIFRAWSDVFGGHERLVRLLAWQAGATWWTNNIVLPFQDAFKSADALAIAPYLTFLPSPDGKLNADAVVKGTADQVLDSVEQISLPEAIQWIGGQKAVADKYGLQLVAYEGGQHLVGVAGAENNDALTKLLMRANASQRLGAIYDKYFRAWRSAGGGTFCYLASVERWSKWGSWGIVQHWDDDVTASPKFQAVLRFAKSCGQTLGAAAAP